MELKYNVTGSERKSLVGAISTVLDAPTKYLGAPTFAYEVGGYHIDKVGTLTGPDNLDLEDALHQAGFDADGDTRKYDEPDTYESGLGGMGALPTPEELEAEAYAEREMKRMAVEAQNVPDYSNRGQYGGDEIPENWEGIGLVIEMPRSSFTDTALDNLKRLVESKGSLIKKALGAETLELEITDDKVRFPWFEDGANPDTVKAYTHFVTALCEMAKNQKRITAKEKETDNEKYAFRCFLLRLGFIGAEYKEERKILLKNLSGSSAFKSGNPKVQELVEHINADASLYDDVMSLQDKEVADDE